MDKDKRNIQPHADKEVKHLMVLLDRSQASEFKKMVPELQDNWVKKQMFRTETEMRFSVLSDNKYGNNAAKYWQSVREQNTHFENLMRLSFEYRKNDVEIKKIQKDIKQEKDPLEKERKVKAPKDAKTRQEKYYLNNRDSILKKRAAKVLCKYCGTPYPRRHKSTHRKTNLCKKARGIAVTRKSRSDKGKTRNSH